MSEVQAALERASTGVWRKGDEKLLAAEVERLTAEVELLLHEAGDVTRMKNAANVRLFWAERHRDWWRRIARRQAVENDEVALLTAENDELRRRAETAEPDADRLAEALCGIDDPMEAMRAHHQAVAVRSQHKIAAGGGGTAPADADGLASPAALSEALAVAPVRDDGWGGLGRLTAGEVERVLAVVAPFVRRLHDESERRKATLDAIRELRQRAVDEELSGPELHYELCRLLDADREGQ